MTIRYPNGFGDSGDYSAWVHIKNHGGTSKSYKGTYATLALNVYHLQLDLLANDARNESTEKLIKK